MRLAHAQGVKLRLVVFAKGRVDLVDDEQHGLLRAAQQVRDLVVRAGQAVLSVDEEEDDVRRVHGDLGLAAHLLQQRVVRIGVDAAGVHEGEFDSSARRSRRRRGRA